MDKPVQDFSDNVYQEIMNAPADRKIGYEGLVEAAWRYYRKAGMPYGESRKGMAPVA